MRTTLELPDQLISAVKIHAAKSDRKLKDVVAELIARGLAQEQKSPSAESELMQFIGAHPQYKSMDEVVAHVRELRKDRDEV